MSTHANQAPENRMRGFFATAIGRPVALMVAFITLIVVGLIAYDRIPLQLFPSEFSEPQLHVWIPNPGASARENEENVARPVEEQLRTLSGIETTHSYSRENIVQLRVIFQANMDMDLARAEIRDRLERARPNLPDTVGNIGMWSESADSMPITFFGIRVRGDADRRDFLMERVVIPRLEVVQGIGNVDIWGVQQDSVRILLDEDKVTASQLDIGQIIGRLSADNFAMPLGDVNDGGREVILRSDMRFKSLKEISEYPIGNGLRLKDLGTVVKRKEANNMTTLIDGDRAFWGMATKDSQSNVVETSKNFKVAIAELENDPALRGDITVMTFFVQGDFIESALGQLRETAMWGGLLAVAVLFIFLRRLRLTLCVALSIPVSVLLAICWEYFTGGSFNLLTMTGITLGIGMLVDNAVVVVENIARIHAKGETPLRASVIGSRQIALAVTLATLTTVVVFLPLIFMTDNKMMRVIFGGLGIPLCMSLLASLLVAIVFLPVLTARVLGARPVAVQQTSRVLDRITHVPARIFAWGVGAVRLAGYGFLRGAFRFNRAAVSILSPLRWVIVLGVLALAYLNWSQLEGAFSLGGVLDEFGVPIGDGATPFRVSTIAIPALVIVLLAILGLKRWKRRPTTPPARPEHFVPQGDSIVQMAVDANHRLVSWTIANRLAASGLAVVAFFSIQIPLNLMTVSAFGQDAVDDDANFRVVYDADFTKEEAEEQARLYADIIESKRAEIRYEHWTCRFDENGANFSIYFDVERPDDEVQQIEKDLERDLPRIPGHRLIFYNADESGGTSNAVANFTLRGPDSRELERLGALAQDILKSVSGLSQVTSPLERAPELIEVSVDREMAHGQGVNTQSIQQSISWALGGFPLPRYQEEGREIPLVVEYDDTESAGLPTLRDLSVWTENTRVPLASIAKMNFTKGARSIYRRNGQTSFTIEAKVDDPLRIIAVTENAYSELAQLELPRGFSWDRSESAMQRTEEEFSELGRAFMLSIVLVFLLMGILFESVLLPFSVLFTIPFAAMGAMWTLFLTGTPMDSFGWIGLIILAGVVVNNGIVLIDRIHGLRKSMERSKAVVLGCGERVQPILMTALTTVCGLTPMMLSQPPSQSMVDYRAMATLVAGGLIASTFFTLWVVPLAYTVLDDLHALFQSRFGWWLRKPGRRSTASSPTPATTLGASASGVRR
jgi:multidrug efflux pump subunit AcrB